MVQESIDLSLVRYVRFDAVDSPGHWNPNLVRIGGECLRWGKFKPLKVDGMAERTSWRQLNRNLKRL